MPCHSTVPLLSVTESQLLALTAVKATEDALTGGVDGVALVLAIADGVAVGVADEEADGVVDGVATGVADGVATGVVALFFECRCDPMTGTSSTTTKTATPIADNFL